MVGALLGLVLEDVVQAVEQHRAVLAVVPERRAASTMGALARATSALKATRPPIGQLPGHHLLRADQQESMSGQEA